MKGEKMSRTEIIEEISKAVSALDSCVQRGLQDGVLPIIQLKTLKDTSTKAVFTKSITYNGVIIQKKDTE